MRNIFKPAAQTASSRERRSVRGVAAVVASVALAAGLVAYPVDAQETAAVSAASTERCATDVETRTLTVVGNPQQYAGNSYTRLTVSGLKTDEMVRKFSVSLSSGKFTTTRLDFAGPLQDTRSGKLTTYEDSQFPNYTELSTTRTVNQTSLTYELNNPVAVGTSSGNVDLVVPSSQRNARYYTVTADVETQTCEEEPTTAAPSATTSPTAPASPEPTAAPTTSPTAPSTSAPSTTEAQPTTDAEPDPQGESTVAEGTFRVVAETDPDDPITLSGIQTSGSNPYTTTATFDQRTVFSGAIIQVDAPNSILVTEQYSFNIDLLESGVELERRVISATSDSVVFEVFPVRDGQRIDNALVEKGATLTVTTQFNDQPKNIDATITVKGTQVPRTVPNTSPIPRPRGEEWLEERIPNPELAKKCGLKVAIVADLSTSLKYADTNGFTASKQAASAMVDALAGTPTEVGIYHFSRTAGTDTNAVSVQDQQGVQTVKDAIAKWGETGQGSTNWEAGLKAVQNQNYDVVYFITDGMPTWDDTGWQRAGETNTGAFVQETSLNQAIIAANKLKSDGTRIVPIMVDLTLKAGNVVTRDYVLQDALPLGATGALAPGRVRFQQDRAVRPADRPKLDYAVYQSPGDDIIVNLEQAQRVGVYDFYKDGKNITSRPELWTRGLREVKQMGEDISGDGDTIRVTDYSLLERQLTSLAADLESGCEGTFTVRKRIVTPDGSVETERAEGWTFSVDAGADVLGEGNSVLTSNSKRTTGADGEVRWKTVNADPATFSVVETRQDPYRIFQRDGANAVCSIRDAADSETSFNLPVTNSGEDGINANIPPYSHVTCVFDNYPPKDEFVRLELEKLDATDNSTLSNAKFEVRSDREGDGPFPVTWDDTSRTYKTEAKLATSEPYFLVETQAPTKDGQSYSLLVAPVEFQIVARDGGYVVQIRDGQNWTDEIVGAGLWTDRPQEFDAATGYLQVANVRQGDLPKTGGAGLELPVLFGGALIAAGALIGRRKVAA